MNKLYLDYLSFNDIIYYKLANSNILSILFKIYVKLVNKLNNKLLCVEPMHEECHMKNQCVKYSTCPMVLANDMLSGKWKMLILWHLSTETLRNSDIKRRLPQVTQKMLTMQLRSLEENKLIMRKVYPEVPPKVEYSLTELGKGVIPLLEMMHSFGSNCLDAGLLNSEVIDNENS